MKDFDVAVVVVAAAVTHSERGADTDNTPVDVCLHQLLLSMLVIIATYKLWRHVDFCEESMRKGLDS